MSEVCKRIVKRTLQIEIAAERTEHWELVIWYFPKDFPKGQAFGELAFDIEKPPANAFPPLKLREGLRPACRSLGAGRGVYKSAVYNQRKSVVKKYKTSLVSDLPKIQSTKFNRSNLLIPKLRKFQTTDVSCSA